MILELEGVFWETPTGDKILDMQRAPSLSFSVFEYGLIVNLNQGHDMSNAKILKLTDADFDAQVKAQPFVVVDFWAEWCGPCRSIAPALEEIAGSLGPKVKVVKLNVDENPQTAAKYGIQSIPTLMIFKNGQLASRQIGAAPKQKLEQWITAAV